MYTIDQILKHRDTPGHGYFSFRAQFSDCNNNVPPQFRQDEYEEDCDWAIPLFFNFGLLKSFKEKRMVLRSLLDWNPDAYIALKKRPPSRALSYLHDKRCKFEENVGMMFCVVGYGDWCYDIPKGYVYRGFVINTGDEDKSRAGDKYYALLTEEESRSLPEFVAPSFITERLYDRDETYYTWDSYTKSTGKERFK
jgi:hypothetical protein